MPANPASSSFVMSTPRSRRRLWPQGRTPFNFGRDPHFSSNAFARRQLRTFASAFSRARRAERRSSGPFVRSPASSAARAAPRAHGSGSARRASTTRTLERFTGSLASSSISAGAPRRGQRPGVTGRLLRRSSRSGGRAEQGPRVVPARLAPPQAARSGAGLSTCSAQYRPFFGRLSVSRTLSRRSASRRAQQRRRCARLRARARRR